MWSGCNSKPTPNTQSRSNLSISRQAQQNSAELPSLSPKTASNHDTHLARLLDVEGDFPSQCYHGQRMPTRSHRALGVYRELQRAIRQLPESNRPYYKMYVRQNFASHRDEDDLERVDEMLDRARRSMKWVLAERGPNVEK